MAPSPTCNECGSRFRPETTEYPSLCPECAHWIYGTTNCNHKFEGSRCWHCLWDGASTAYIESIKRREADKNPAY